MIEIPSLARSLVRQKSFSQAWRRIARTMDGTGGAEQHPAFARQSLYPDRGHSVLFTGHDLWSLDGTRRLENLGPRRVFQPGSDSEHRGSGSASVAKQTWAKNENLHYSIQGRLFYGVQERVTCFSSEGES